MQVDIINTEGKVKGQAQLPESIGEGKANPHLVHEVVRAYLANQRKGTHATLTRSHVHGGGRKPWKQKGTGRARSGTSRSPLWRGGGIIFGPHPRSYRIDLPHHKIKKVLSQVISAKAQNGEVIVADPLKLEEAKTKKVADWMRKLSLPQNSLLVLDKMDKKLHLASRNLRDFEIMECRHLHPYHILNAKKIIFTPEAVQCL